MKMPALHLGAPVQAGPLTVFPVWTDAPLDVKPYRTTLPKTARVGEQAGGPSVPQLTVSNPGAVPVLMFEGALFDGGWQHRVLASSILIGARSDLEVDVRCIEQRRWSGGHDQRLSARRAPLAVRGALRGLRHEADRFEAEAGRHSDQGDVWQRVQHYEQRHGASRTSSLVEVQGGLDRQVEAILAAVRPLPAQRGVLIGVDGHPALLEVFDHPDTLAAQWDAILASVAMDALLLPVTVPTPGHRARAFIGATMATELQDAGRAGAALAVAGSDRNLVSARGVATDRLIHAAVVNARHQLVLAA